MKNQLKIMLSVTEDKASNEEIKTRIFTGGQVTGTNLSVLLLAMLIASVGLNVDSTPVVIGAMLISPLMGSLLALAYSTVTGDIQRFSNFFTGLLFQVGLSILVSALYFYISPLKTVTNELSARVSPTFYDVIIAFCGGLAGIIGSTRKEKANNIVPGVAIATALMPPLCTMGFAIANGHRRMFLASGYLFLVNAYFIYLSASLVLNLYQLPKSKELSVEEVKAIKFMMIRNTIIILIPSLIFGYRMIVG
ncbi:uncharacterized hydrophobic domain-containing protein [Granulicatella balaenopterae]|uniref:Uncharacterized hydrophobic domain-containing protein n=1 Tax=Granulicatella balaenopterae TaxID=137733 RepID=A0A1H9HD27_9LACT|nr:DUF389 domain-containing protein [Granulicatella balaenopterae]SEQ60219.1 uncharacterized hydrophobic domain-containing protein [Granulicatella balaenopterae]